MKAVTVRDGQRQDTTRLDPRSTTHGGEDPVAPVVASVLAKAVGEKESSPTVNKKNSSAYRPLDFLNNLRIRASSSLRTSLMGITGKERYTSIHLGKDDT